MAVEPRRGCGYRKVGGIYLCADSLGEPCCKLPILLTVCPTCNAGIKQTRGWQWIDPQPWLEGACSNNERPVGSCPAAEPEALGERVGLLWIGERFYKTPAAFAAEAKRMGISRRIQAVPRGFKLGEHYVFLAHPRVKESIDKDGVINWIGGVFRIFRPTRIEKIITASDSKDEAEMKKLADTGITPIIVPDSDPDHQGSVYDDDNLEPELALEEQN